jgi:hypothetical protein
MSFLTPLGALAALVAFVPLVAGRLGRARVAATRRALRLPDPARPSGLVRPASAAAGIALLGLAAAQPALTHETTRRLRTDVQALFVLDTSRSMAASSTRSSATRLDRAILAAVRLRAAIPGVAAGVATLTDRVLPDLLPVGDVSAFESVVERTVGVERPPPRYSSLRATAFGALTQISSGDYFDRAAKRRIVVLLTDGESGPVNSGEVARLLAAAHGYRFFAIRLWQSGEAVYGSNGAPEAGYRPDPSGQTILAALARATGGRAFEESQVGSASSYLTGLVGNGPARATRAGEPGKTPLAPYVAGVALLLVLASFWPVQARFPRVGLLHQ